MPSVSRAATRPPVVSRSTFSIAPSPRSLTPSPTFLNLCRFRQEYRLERKLLNDLSIDPQSSDDLLSSLTALSSASPLSLLSVPWSAPRHRISRVVVLHNDKLETFFDDDDDRRDSGEDPCESDHRSEASEGAFSVSGIHSCSSSAPFSPPLSANFFDNDSFWSGSITWY